MISKDEFEKINYSVKYIWEASRRNPSHERNLLTFARFFDPSSGLKYFLRTMGDHNYSSAKEEEYAASELFNSSIAPVSLKEQIARFLTQYFSSEDLITTGLSRSPVDVKLKATQDFIALLCEEIQQAFSLYYTPLQSESAKDMARYFQIAIFMNLVSFNNLDFGLQ